MHPYAKYTTVLSLLSIQQKANNNLYGQYLLGYFRRHEILFRSSITGLLRYPFFYRLGSSCYPRPPFSFSKRAGG